MIAHLISFNVMCLMHQLIIRHKNTLSNIHMPFCPRIPNHQIVPTVSPGHDKQAQGVVIKYVHAVVFHPGRYASTGGGPLGQHAFGIVVSDYDCKKRLIASIM
jgi:hypothetical protein